MLTKTIDDIRKIIDATIKDGSCEIVRCSRNQVVLEILRTIDEKFEFACNVADRLCEECWDRYSLKPWFDVLSSVNSVREYVVEYYEFKGPFKNDDAIEPNHRMKKCIEMLNVELTTIKEEAPDVKSDILYKYGWSYDGVTPDGISVLLKGEISANSPILASEEVRNKIKERFPDIKNKKDNGGISVGPEIERLYC